MTNFMVNGNVSRAAKTRMATTPSGQQTLVTDFNVAVNDGAGDSEITTYYKVTLWGQKGANLAPYLTVGKEINVKGILLIKRAEVQLKGKKALAEAEPVEAEDLPFPAGEEA